MKINKKTKVVIVGGGFGGVYTARNLVNRDDIEVTLINKTNYFLFTPLLHEVATGALTPDSIVEPIREIFRNKKINFIEDTVIEINESEKYVNTTKSKIDFDFLVISTGADTNYFNTPGAKEYTFTLKSLPDAIAIRNHILDICDKANSTKNKELLTFSVIGAGPTGVEFSAELIEYVQHTMCSYYRNSGFKPSDIKVNLITATPDLISRFPQKMKEIALDEVKNKGINVILNEIVSKVEPGKIHLKSGAIIDSHTNIWVAGVMPILKEINGAEVGTTGRYDTNESLQSKNHAYAFGLGDSSGSFPMLAQIAVQQAKVVAKNITKLVDDSNAKLDKFVFTEKGLLISLGQWYAAGHFLGFTFKGKIMWWVWRTVYLFNFNSWRKRFEIATEWTINLFYPRDITLLK